MYEHLLDTNIFPPVSKQPCKKGCCMPILAHNKNECKLCRGRKK